jgi:hypothetical protein
MKISATKIYILSCRLTELRSVLDILRKTHMSYSSEKDKAAINTAETKIAAIVARSEDELAKLLEGYDDTDPQPRPYRKVI